MNLYELNEWVKELEYLERELLDRQLNLNDTLEEFEKYNEKFRQDRKLLQSFICKAKRLFGNNESINYKNEITDKERLDFIEKQKMSIEFSQFMGKNIFEIISYDDKPSATTIRKAVDKAILQTRGENHE